MAILPTVELKNVEKSKACTLGKVCYNQNMETMRAIVAANLADLRKSENLTQAEFAARLNYSDKAVSKWERGDSLPDVVMLKTIADMYHLRVDDFLTEHGVLNAEAPTPQGGQTRWKVLVVSLWVSVVWIVAAVIFLYSQYSMGKMFWMAFVWAVPCSFLVALWFSLRWGARNLLCPFSSGLVWSVLIGFYFQYLQYNIWMIFFVGIPVQIALIIGSKIREYPHPRGR